MSSKKSRNGFIPPVPIEKFKIDRFYVEDLDMDNPKAKAQGIAFPKYDHRKYNPTNVTMCTKWMKISSYGIPRSTADDDENNYYNEDKQRSFLKFPIDPEQENCVALGNVLAQIDDELSSKKFKKKLFRNINDDDNIYKMFKHTKTVRLPKKQLGKKNKTTKKYDGPPIPYCKFRFAMDWDTKKLLTRVFVCDNMDDEGTPVDTETLEQMEKYVGWGCDVQIIFTINKLWAAKTPDDDNKCGYGITLKILQMRVIPRSTSSSKEQFKKNRFGSKYESDSDSGSD